MTTSFNSNPELLSKLLGLINDGKLALPEFQRDWRWDEDRVVALLASIAQGFPIGTVMTLETGGEVRFKMRPISGAPALEADPGLLVLDGQQRLTSLYQVLRAGQIVSTLDKRKKPIERWFYIDIEAVLSDDADFEEMIHTVDHTKVRTAFNREVELDVSTDELEWASGSFPMSIIFDTAKMNAWQYGFCSAAGQEDMPRRVEMWNAFHTSVIQAFQLYQLPVIELQRGTTREAVCRVFEKVNTGGIPLDVFELVTAAFAADDFDLREDWKARQAKFRQNPYLANILGAVENTDFLQAVTLLKTLNQRSPVDGIRAAAVSCKRKDILKLDHADYERHADAVADGFIEVAQLLHEQKFFAARDLPYRTQLVPLAAALAVLGAAGKSDPARRKLARWYWCGVFGELYGGAIETRFARDVPDLIAWVNGDPLEPKTILDSNFAASRLLTLQTRNSAAYKGMHALLMRDGCRDFLEGTPIDMQTFTDGAIDIHHVFPQKWYGENGVDQVRGNSIINKTPLTASTNRIIGGSAPSIYLKSLEARASIDADRLDALVQTHAIDSVSLRADDFDSFFRSRASALIDRIESATGKTVQRDLEDLGVIDEEQLTDYEGGLVT
jgi:hypothetical protein